MEHSVFSSVVPKSIPTVAKVPASDVHSSGVSWAAVFGGAFVTAALSLILLSLGTGLGMASLSPWANTRISAATIGGAAILWLILMQLIASAVGGYLAGRLRQKWPSIHTDEVYFRDTAHGFLAWAVAIVITAAFLASAATTLAGGSIQAAAQAEGDSNAYFVDMLLRSNGPNTESNDAGIRAEIERIFVNALRQDDIPAADKSYLAQVVSARTSLSPDDANLRVSDALGQARSAALQTRQAAETARKAAAHLSLWVFVALLVGAFSASIAATIGGSQRDHVVVI